MCGRPAFCRLCPTRTANAKCLANAWLWVGRLCRDIDRNPTASLQTIIASPLRPEEPVAFLGADPMSPSGVDAQEQAESRFLHGLRRDLYVEFLRVPSEDFAAVGYWWYSLFNTEIPYRGCIRALVRVWVQCAKPWEIVGENSKFWVQSGEGRFKPPTAHPRT